MNLRALPIHGLLLVSCLGATDARVLFGPHTLDSPYPDELGPADDSSPSQLESAGGSLRGEQTPVSPDGHPLVASQDNNIFDDETTPQCASTWEIFNGDLYEIVNCDGADASPAADATEAASVTSDPGTSSASRQKKIWDLIATFDDYKTSNLYELVNGKPTLTSFKYMMLPIWWDGENTTDPQWTIDPAQINDVMQQVSDYYLSMSWNKVDLQWQTLDQKVLTGVTKANPDFGNTATAARNIVSQTYVKGADYDGISLVYHVATGGPFSGGGGWANVNGDFMWNSYQMSYGVTRHEVGHNFGHPHHKKHSYEYRNAGRPDMNENWDGLDYGYDGWDMMSGGNAYAVSHFAAASKWFWNWIEDSSIIHMQPEGPTTECPNCAASGSFRLVPFDDKDLPPTQDRKMGIHIPISAQGVKLYSFWLSYRSPIEGARDGLSVHFTEFSLRGIFGATYDSHRYFAFGDLDKNHAFVLVDTCYYLFPSAYMKDKDYLAADDVHPVVCVDAIDGGVSIDVTVSFIDPQNPPPSSPQVNPILDSMVVNCSDTPVDYTLDANRFHAIHMQNTGSNGDVTISMCTDDSSANVRASAYLSDQHPYSALSYDSPASYGAFKSMEAISLECCTPGSTISIPGAKVVRIKQNRNEFMHLNEIQIFDQNGTNVALDGRCFSYSIGYGGNSDCLNDNVMGIYPNTCNSHSRGYDINNYDYCVLGEATAITSVKIYPWHDPTRTWMTQRLDNINLSVFADVSGQGESAEFIGLLYTEDLMNEFTSSQTGPREYAVTIPDTIDCPNTNQNPTKSLAYRSDYDTTYVVIPPSSGATSAGSRTTAMLSCNVNSCMQNSYKLNDECVPCPPGQRAPSGSTDASACTFCPGGTLLSHQYALQCTVSNSQTQFASSTGWRIWATDFQTQADWVWDVAELEFYNNVGCSGAKISNALGTPIDSGNAGSGWGPEGAFDGGGVWGGRKDSDGLFWLGLQYSNAVSVKCVRVLNSGGHSTTEIRIQALNADNRWENAWVQTDYDSSPNAWNAISMEYGYGLSPSKSPTSSPSRSPVACTLADIGESCVENVHCCSNSCSGGKKSDRVCLANGPTTAAPTASPSMASPTPPGSCKPAGESCSDASVNCCNGCSSGKPSTRMCL